MSSREYPAWFWRLRDLQQDRKARGQQNRYYDSDLPVEPKDFDEDLSECSDDSEESCSSENGCTSESSELSDVSGKTSATEAAYYALKEQREERKTQLKVWQRQGMSGRQNESVVEEALQAEIKNEESEIQKVKAALAKTENSSKKKSGPLKGLDCLSRPLEDLSRSGRREPVEGHVYLIHGDAYNVDPFVRPKYPSTKFHQLKVDRGRRTVDVQFFHEHFPVLRMHRDIVFSHQGIQPPMDAPEIFTYYGYDEGYEFPDERRKEKAKRRRSASPQ
ncbi:hypothetical protein FMUND_11030 [Fusarium mundagurra]|uniref:Uncharacterized protein n=1 Tax=Fusarium mundagurra TaxID=1567541 RepID=A0A8H5Y8M2_9HYPO|nr:hypothetical protein FMUND_11030 [Fusarium mundagurra]